MTKTCKHVWEPVRFEEDYSFSTAEVFFICRKCKSYKAEKFKRLEE